jgi:glycosyltransferase involved in cell wall biosynthesis
LTSPRVTVTIPTYNRSDLLRRAIESVLAQTFTDFEVIVANNGSTDDTAAVIASIADPRVKHAPLDRNVGMLGNLNRCLGMGTAPYMVMLHDDDLMRPSHLSSAVAVLDEHPEVVFVHSAFSMIDGDDRVFVERKCWGEPIDPLEPPAVFVRRTYWCGNRVVPSGIVVRRSAVAGLQFEEEDGAGNDMGLWLRVARQGVVAFLTDPTIGLRVHGGQVTSQLGWGDPSDPSDYLATFDGVEMMRRIKMRFARRFDGDPLPGWKLRLLARWRARADLGPVLRESVLRAETDGDRRAMCRRALSIEPAVLLSAAAGEAFAMTLFGDPGYKAAARVRPAAQRLRQRLVRLPSL